MEMTRLLAEDQPILDEHGAVNLDVKKPAIFKSQSIILSDEELKELGMKTDENAITCDIAEEDEDDVNVECDPIQNNKDDENTEIVNNVDDQIDAVENPDADALEDSNKEDIEQANPDNIEENKAEQDVNTEDEGKTENESTDETLAPEQNPDAVAADVEPANEDKTPKETEKPNESKTTKPRPISGHKFKIPPMWTPGNARANAAFVYVFFRNVGFYDMKRRNNFEKF